jgi:hypothetical protein
VLRIRFISYRFNTLSNTVLDTYLIRIRYVPTTSEHSGGIIRGPNVSTSAPTGGSVSGGGSFLPRGKYEPRSQLNLLLEKQKRVLEIALKQTGGGKTRREHKGISNVYRVNHFDFRHVPTVQRSSSTSSSLQFPIRRKSSIYDLRISI